MSRVYVGATALTYNTPSYGQYGKDLGPRVIQRLTLALQRVFPEATVTSGWIGRRVRDYPGDCGNASWGVEFTTTSICTEGLAEKIGEEIAGLLFGQYGLGDDGELEDVTVTAD